MDMEEHDTEKKAVDLIATAISSDSTGFAAEAENIAAAIEAELVKEFGGSHREFRAKVRSIVFNLKDPKNTSLRESLLNGTLSPATFAHMDVHALANPERQGEWHKLEEKVLEETIIQKLPPGEESSDIKRVEFLTAVGRMADQEQATHPPPDEHQQMLQSQ